MIHQPTPPSPPTNPTIDITASTPNIQVRLPDIILLHCPTCKHAVDGTKTKFDTNKLNERTWCKDCHRQRFVRLWQCRCGIPWHTCNTHRGEPARLRRTSVPTTTATTSPPPINTHQIGSSRVETWLRQPGRHTTGQNDITFTKQDEEKAKAMVSHRALQARSAPTSHDCQ